MKEFGALIFDVDGTMAETEELHRRAFNECFARFCLDWTWDTDLYARLLRITGGKERIAHFIDEYRRGQETLSAADIVELHSMKNRRYAELLADGHCPLRPGVADVIELAKLRGQRLAIATTTSRSNVDALLSPVMGKTWPDVFHAVVAGEDVERKKPAPDAYFKAVESLGLPAQACLAFEDSRNGLLAAQAAGVPVVITRSMYFGDEDFEGAFAVVDDLAEFLDSPHKPSAGAIAAGKLL